MARRASVLVMALVTVAAAELLAATASRAQGPPPFATAGPPRTDPIPPGRRIEVADGDTVVINNNDRVRFVRRREGAVRIVVDAAAGFALVIADYPPLDGATPDGRVDETFTFRNLQGEWTLEPRWEGPAAVEEMTDFTRPDLSLAVESARGVVLFESSGPRVMTERRDDDIAPVAVLRHRSSGRTTGGSLSFDEVEAMARRDVATRQGGTVVSTPGGSYSSESFARPGGRAGTPPGDAAVRGPAPMRAGGNIPPPQRIRHVPPAYPPDALAARIQGVVIVEVTIGTDGSVSDARILRSIPLLDAAALDAVRQWKFTPTLLNGQPVPVIMTTTVNFALP